MRLIDGDALIEKFNENVYMAECLIDARTAERFATFCALADAVEEMPTVDAVEVVRCRECKFRSSWMMNRNLRYICPESGLFPNGESDFCSYGERKDGDWNG